MRLVHIESEHHFSLVEFTGQAIPPYAILSHTWGPDHEEVTFQELSDGTGLSKAGYDKIQFCGRQAANYSLQYFWIDTCCIDKISSAELTESINSMFIWYKEAAVCYVLLMDLPANARLEMDLPNCRWFTRGWTLQELIAPERVILFDQSLVSIGSKGYLVEELSCITGIEEDVLNGEDLALSSVAVRMRWAASRQTKRIEDRAYSLLGMFDVSIPLIYGEGRKAFRRLQEEIIKRDNDLTRFA
ncbi:HET-domain-containing protein [Setomelanomma holmii]|uniref:HET-domain-containing protein n=1 Tax=Setomelanomma holmii TaxID=210430 RepID=A0A9P4H801_9PLEO|nr:HET-domain-containing protein [Setomelanomma holmii]